MELNFNLKASKWLPWPGWHYLPRDARDTLFLLFVIAWTVLPHVSHLPAWCSLLTLAVLLWRAQLAMNNSPLPSRWVLVGVLIMAIGLTLWSHRTLLSKDSGVTMTVVLMALKTLELRARRDSFVVFFLGFFLVLTHFLYSQSLTVAGAMLVSVWGLLTALVLAHMPVGQPSLRQASALAARTALFGAPIMALMFLLFPRIGPLWGMPQDGSVKTGLSTTMRLGSVAEVAQDDSVAMRLRFEGEPPSPDSMYFRGPVLSLFNGDEWQVSRDRTATLGQSAAGIRPTGTSYRYEVTLEPMRITSIPLLEATQAGPDIQGFRVIGLSDMQWLADRPLNERMRFKVESTPQFRYGPITRTEDLRQELELPEGYNPRTIEWANELHRDPVYANASSRVLANALLKHIRLGKYSYTLAPGEYGGNSIDTFWLDRREGFCEHFAAAFVFIMRALGVPARVVTGYQGTDLKPVDGYYIVRQSSAHAWAEYWEPGTGWVRADPTAAVAPERIFRSSRLALAPGMVANAFGNVSPEMMARVREGWELLNNRWNQWVLGYSRGQQFDVLKKFGIQSPSWEDLAKLLVGALSSLALLGAAWAWWDRNRVDPWVRQMERLRRSLLELGLTAARHDSPRALATRVRERFGAAGEPLASLLDSLERQRYSRSTIARPDGSLTRRFVSLARSMRSMSTMRAQQSAR